LRPRIITPLDHRPSELQILSSTEESMPESIPPSNNEPQRDAAATQRDLAYWHANVRLICTLLAVWAAASLGASTLFIDLLNKIKFGQVPLGFWMAHQGTIYLFIALIGVYIWQVEKLDRTHGDGKVTQR
jgi:putative solute:sodium symporter small subunit